MCKVTLQCQIFLSGPRWPLTSRISQVVAPTPPLLYPGPLPGRKRGESQLSWSGWLRVTEASCSTGAVPSYFHFIYLLSLFPPSIYSFFLSLPLPVDQLPPPTPLHAELHCAQSTVAEQMASLCFLSLFLKDSRSLSAVIHCYSFITYIYSHYIGRTLTS